MEHPKNKHILLTATGKVRAFAEVGCYPLYYITADGGTLSPAAVQEELERCCDKYDSQWYVIGHDANWENLELFCDHLGTRIESAYAEA